jgi:hypothetical protein
LEAISIGLVRCLEILAPIVFGIIAAVAIAAAKGIGNIEPFRKKIETFKQLTNNQDEI